MSENLPIVATPSRYCSRASGELRILFKLGELVMETHDLREAIAHLTGAWSSADRWPKLLALVERRREELRRNLDAMEQIIDENTKTSHHLNES